jgi:hypothetical protein
MDINELINQLAEKIELDEEKELFFEAIYELGDEVSIDDVLSLYEGIGNANNELDSSSADRAYNASGLNKSSEGSVDPLHAKFNSDPKSKQDGSKLGKKEKVLAGDDADTKLDSHAAGLNKDAQIGQDSSKLNKKQAIEDKGKGASSEPSVAKVNAIAKENIQQNRKLYKESLDISDDISAIFEGTDLTEDFKEKAQIIFESAIKVKFDNHMELIEESVADIITEEIEAYKEEISERIEKYLDYIVEEFLEQNEVALTSGIKVEIAESLFDGFRNLISEHNIDVAEEKLDLVDDVVAENEKLEESYNAEVEKNIELREELKDLKKEILISELTEGLTAMEADKFSKLVEGIEFVEEESFINKVSILVEAYTSETGSVTNLTESTDYDDEVDEEIEVSSDVKRVLNSLGRFGK